VTRRIEHVRIKDEKAYEAMYRAGQLLASLFEELRDFIRPAIATIAIDDYVVEYLKRHDLVSQTKGYHGYRHVSCISINDEVVHGVPSARRVMQEGDLVKVDICAAWNGYCADMARCFFAGNSQNGAVRRLVEVAQKALDAGIQCAVPGGRLGTLSAAIQRVAESAGYSVVRDFAGHGIGASMHEEPEVLNYGVAGEGLVIKPGMAFAIEPMLTAGSCEVIVERDRWTVRTVDHSIAAHIEDTVFVTEQGPVVITRAG